ncbi:hypothetical protein HNR42_002599 [Deinobacterium chartae]|uniref:DUF5666 domain-containing protein n=1 Tax=Deinobacterium chartae TaxID=521158 RepID=A0A841I1P2_9DEIO|nr:hypothetical protein [Deinobacterium chartae]MBB6099163.1 hypothetical protein [Deinobacterium chartae]
MKKHLVWLTLGSFLVLGVASAQTSTPTAPQPNTQALSRLLGPGQTLELLDANGTTLGTLRAGGTLEASGNLSQAVRVRVSTPAADGTALTRTYTLSGRLPSSGQIKVETLNVQDKTQSVPLVAVLRRQSEQAHQANEERRNRSAQPENDTRTNPERGGKPEKNPGKGHR